MCEKHIRHTHGHSREFTDKEISCYQIDYSAVAIMRGKAGNELWFIKFARPIRAEKTEKLFKYSQVK